ATSLPLPALSAQSPWRSFEITTRVELSLPEGESRVWLPLPLVAENDWQRALDNSWKGNARAARIARDGKYGLTMLNGEWPAREVNPVIEVTSRFATRDRDIDPSRPVAGAERLSSSEVAFYTAPTEYIPTDGIVHDTARGIVKGAGTDVEKARAIYEWIV